MRPSAMKCELCKWSTWISIVNAWKFTWLPRGAKVAVIIEPVPRGKAPYAFYAFYVPTKSIRYIKCYQTMLHTASHIFLGSHECKLSRLMPFVPQSRILLYPSLSRVGQWRVQFLNYVTMVFAEVYVCTYFCLYGGKRGCPCMWMTSSCRLCRDVYPLNS